MDNSLILLTFLGIGRYETVTYVWRDKTYTTHLFPEAASAFFQPDRVLVCVTERVKQQSEYFQKLSERLGDRLRPIDIPEGRSKDDFWKIFDCIANAIGEGEDLVLDITHALRSLPLLIFAVAAYLRRTKGVTVRHIIYGAYEARDEQNRSPIFDLTPLLDLLDWLSGAEALLDQGNARLLAQKVEQIHQNLWKERTADKLPQRLKKIAKELRELSQALQLSRPRDVMRLANKLLLLLNNAQSEGGLWAKPFALIVDQIRKDIEPLAYENPNRLDVENLRRQLALIKYYLNKGLIVQEVTLAREWVVNWTILRSDRGDWMKNWMEKCCRKEVEEVLRAASAAWKQKKKDAKPPPEWFQSLPNAKWFQSLSNAKRITCLWSELSELRNYIAHCGMREKSIKISTIEQRAKEIPQKLQALLDSVPA